MPLAREREGGKIADLVLRWRQFEEEEQWIVDLDKGIAIIKIINNN